MSGIYRKLKRLGVKDNSSELVGDLIYSEASSGLIPRDKKLITDYFSPASFLVRTKREFQNNPSAEKDLVRKYKKYFDVEGETLADIEKNLIGDFTLKDEVANGKISFTGRGKQPIIVRKELAPLVGAQYIDDSEFMEKAGGAKRKGQDTTIKKNLDNVYGIFQLNRMINDDTKKRFPELGGQVTSVYRTEGGAPKSDHKTANAMDFGFSRGPKGSEASVHHLLEFLSDPNNDDIASQIIYETTEGGQNWIHFTGRGNNELLGVDRKDQPTQYFIYHNHEKKKRPMTKDEFANYVLDHAAGLYPSKETDNKETDKKPLIKRKNKK